MTPARLRNFVNGKLTDPLDGTYSDVIDPSTGEVYAQAPVSSAAEVDEALTAAAVAFESWRDSTPAERSLALLKFADAVERRAADFVEAETRNTGKPVALAAADEVPPSVDQLRFFAGAARVLEAGRGQHGRAQAVRHHAGLDRAAGRGRGRVLPARGVQRDLRRPRTRPCRPAGTASPDRVTYSSRPSSPASGRTTR